MPIGCIDVFVIVAFFMLREIEAAFPEAQAPRPRPCPTDRHIDAQHQQGGSFGIRVQEVLGVPLR